MPGERVGRVGCRRARCPSCAISVCISSLRPVECAIDQMPASIAFLAPFTVCTCPSTFNPAFAASLNHQANLVGGSRYGLQSTQILITLAPNRMFWRIALTISSGVSASRYSG